MTTKVTVEVPDGVKYAVEVMTISGADVERTVYLQAGERIEMYLHDSLSITGIKEVPVDAA